MPASLPSLSALKVFEVSGRLQSFTAAAAELNVSQAAVSHQIRSLEEQLGQKLFTRTTRKLALTAAGERLLPAAHQAFSTLERAIGDLRATQSVLTITTTPFFGSRWLAPRLARFNAKHPKIDVSVRHTNAMLDLNANNIDLALRCGRGQWAGLKTHLITPLALTPVATPDYIARLRLQDPSDIARALLLHDETREEWREWLTVAGVNTKSAQKGPVYDDEHVLIAAARNGHGIALASRALVEEDIRAGTLAPIFDVAWTCDWGYYLVYPPANADQPKVRAFCDFTLKEIKSVREQA